MKLNGKMNHVGPEAFVQHAGELSACCLGDALQLGTQGPARPKGWHVEGISVQPEAGRTAWD